MWRAVYQTCCDAVSYGSFADRKPGKVLAALKSAQLTLLMANRMTSNLVGEARCLECFQTGSCKHSRHVQQPRCCAEVPQQHEAVLMSASVLLVCAVCAYGGNVCWVMRHSQGDAGRGCDAATGPTCVGANVRAPA